METSQYFLLENTAVEYLIFFPLLICSFPPKKTNFMQEINIAEQENLEAKKAVFVPKAASEEELGLAAACSQLIQFVNPQSELLSWGCEQPGALQPKPRAHSRSRLWLWLQRVLSARVVAAPQGALWISFQLAPN